MLSDESPAEKLDENNKKRLQKIVGKILYYAREVEHTILMGLNSLVAVQIKPKIKTARQITQFLNYSATHLDTVKEYRRSGIIIHIYSDALYISEPEARNRSGGCFSKDQNPNIPIQSMPPENGPEHVQCIIMRNVMASTTAL